jgi:hypothetical protein
VPAFYRFMSKEFEAFLGKHSIKCKHTVPATPQQSSVAERKNRTLAEIVTAMLNNTKLPKSFWGKVLSMANKVLNMLPANAIPADTMLFKLTKHCKPDYSVLHVFGCCAYVHIDKKKHKLLDLHTIPCIYMGYPNDYCGWKVWDPQGKRMIISRDIIWNKSEMPGNSQTPVLLLTVLQGTAQVEEGSSVEAMLDVVGALSTAPDNSWPVPVETGKPRASKTQSEHTAQ